MIKKIISIVIFMSICSVGISQTDTAMMASRRDVASSSRLKYNKAIKIVKVPALLLATSFAYKSFDGRFNNARNSYTPHFSQSFDDVTQYLPAAVMLALRATNAHGGGRSESWGEMLTADAFSVLIMTGLVNGIKYTANVPRPDNGSRNSFPSGHTATAFMTASLLHKEYGHINKWYSIGAYTVASATGITRILNNRHWVSDVFAGAAVGILSVELGYLISDKIFKREPKEYEMYENAPSFGPDTKPSFVGLYTGVDINIDRYTTSNGDKATIESGSKSGVEGAWYITPYLGVGGLFTATTSTIEVANQPHTTLNTLGAAIGVYLSYPLNSVLRVGTKALAGTRYIHNYSEIDPMFGAGHYKMNFQTGLSLSYLASSSLAFNLFADYSNTPKFIMNKAANELTCGVSINLVL